MNTTPSQRVELLAQLDKALEATIEFGKRRLGAPEWEPAPGSEAATEFANTEVGANGVAWGDRPPRAAYTVANLLMKAVLDDLMSLKKLLGEPMPVLGSTIIARSAIEIGATAWWLMEPGIGARRRVNRELVLSLTSARRAGHIARSFSTAAGKSDALKQEGKVLQRITDLGFPAPTGKNKWEPVIDGEACKGATTLTGDLLHGVFNDGTSSETVYQAYSATMHGTIYGLMNFLTEVVLPDGQTLAFPDGEPFLLWHLPNDVLDSTVQLAIVAFHEPLKRIGKLMKWGRIEEDLWEHNLRLFFNGQALG